MSTHHSLNSRMFLCSAIAACLLLPTIQFLRADAPETGRLGTPVHRRIVKQFDFNERIIGNYERIPMHWKPIVGPGFPRYLEPAFDDAVGDAAPPSFRLALQGGNIGADYVARDIDVLPGSDYQVVASIRAARLFYAHARIDACFLDESMQPVPGSRRSSPPVRASDNRAPWVKVQFTLPGGVANARWIGLRCIVEQPALAEPSSASVRPIFARDVHGTAWFDDISVIRLPQASLSLQTPVVPDAAGVFAEDEPIEVLPRIADPDGAELSGLLEILDAGAVPICRRTVPIIGVRQEPAPIELDVLTPGAYTARLIVLAATRELARIERPFLRLGTPSGRNAAPNPAFGLTIDAIQAADLRTISRLIHMSGAGKFKLPLWQGASTDDQIVYGDAAVNRFVDAFVQRGMQPVALLESVPQSLAEQFPPARRGLLEVLSSTPERWRPWLALPLTHLGARIRFWQVGSDDGSATEGGRNVDAALTQLQSELAALVDDPVVIAPRSALAVPGSPAVPDCSIFVPDSIPADLIVSQIAFPRDSELRWLTVASPDPARYSRLSRLGEMTRRLIAARAAGTTCVFIQQPWAHGPDDPAPLEDYAVFHTLATTLNGLDRVSQVWIDDAVTAWLFSDATAQRGAIVAWSDSPARVPCCLGPRSTTRTDIWGANTTTQTASHSTELATDVLPAIFGPLEPWRIQTQAAFAHEAVSLAPALGPQPRTVRILNARSSRMRGTIRLICPTGIQVSPSSVPIDIEPGRHWDATVDFAVPTNFPTGDYVLRGLLRCDAGERVDLPLRAPLRVASPGLDVSVLHAQHGGLMRVMQRVTNRGSEMISLRSSLVAPDRPRQTRLINNLDAGQSITLTYVLSDQDLSQMSTGLVRVSVEQLDGDAIHNQLVQLK